MDIDYTAVELILSYLEGQATIDDIWETEAYKTIRLHADKLRGGLTREQIEKALEGERTGYYGVNDLKENLDKVKELMKKIRDDEKDWLNIIENEFDRIVPDERKDDITIHPVFGYDIGIGLDNDVCINLNEQLFFDDPREFIYLAIHESSHVLYERIHGIPSIDTVESSEERMTFFNTFFQTEGYAVYSPLKLRQKHGRMEKKNHFILEDYRVISDEDKIQEHIEKYDILRDELKESGEWTFEKFMKKAFGKDRLAYRVGGTMVKNIEEKEGIDEVRNAFHTDPDGFVKQYDRILDEYRD